MNAAKYVEPANHLLAALSNRHRREFIASCDRVELAFGEVLYKSNERLSHVYFPLDSFISLVTGVEGGGRLEVGIVGDEGMFGSSLLLGVNDSPQHALVQGGGGALRMSAAAFRSHVAASSPLRLELGRYIYVLMGQLALTALCARYHLVEARLARWLLLTRDRAHSSEFRLTHEFLAYMLGVRRVGITQAASALQARGLLDYRRGRIVIRDVAGLEKASCACYRQANALYQRTLGAQQRVRGGEPALSAGG